MREPPKMQIITKGATGPVAYLMYAILALAGVTLVLEFGFLAHTLFWK